MNASKNLSPSISVLLADDDPDDRFFFKKALDTLNIDTSYHAEENGANLLSYLLRNIPTVPDVIFLDLNMPKKNGMECLVFIKGHQKLKEIPVIIYSTSLHDDIADLLYSFGAHFYVRKTEFQNLKKILDRVFKMMANGPIGRPLREQFIIEVGNPQSIT